MTNHTVLLPSLIHRLSAAWAILGATCVLILSAPVLQAAAIPKLFNTGVDDSGKVLGASAVDPHYTIIEIPEAVTVSSNAFTLVAGFPVGPWLPEGPASRWIAPKANQSPGSDPGNYTYRTTFDLTGFDPAKARITGRWVSDNGGADVMLNGASLGLSNPGTFTEWGEASNFEITFGFVDGTNTLDFVVNNAGDTINPTGLRVEMLGSVELPDEAPTIVTQPIGATLIAGEDLQLTVLAQGTQPLTYQWQLNGTDVAGATDTTYLITGARTDQGGDYTVVVKNAFGTKTSAVAKVTVLEPIPGLFSTGVGTDGVVLDDGATDPHYKLTVNPDETGADAIVQDSTVFPIVTGPWLANSDVSKWIGPRFETSASAGGEYVYRLEINLADFDPTSVVLFGKWSTDNPGLDILLNGAATGIQNNGGFGAFSSFSMTNGFVSGTNTLDFKLRNEGVGYTGLRVESLRAGGLKKTGPATEPARIVTQPKPAVLLAGETLSLNVVADGTPPLSYQWRFNGTDVAGQTQPALSLTNVTGAQAGKYSVKVSNTAGSIESAVVDVLVLEPVPGVFNTGVGADGLALEDGEVDPHYMLTTNALDAALTDAIVLDSTVFPIVEGPWLPNTAGAKWIGAQKDPNVPGGDYAFRTSFNLDGFDPATARVMGEWATDNGGTDILLNGQSVGLQNTAQFSVVTSFTIVDNPNFKAGVNTLEFLVNNAGVEANPGGLRVSGLRVGAVKSQGAGLRLAAPVSKPDGTITLTWSGGAPPFVVQKKISLSDANWVNVLTNATSEATLPATGPAGFFRVRDQAQ